MLESSNIKTIDISKIRVEGIRLRKVDAGVAHLLAEDIQEFGLFHPIAVRPYHAPDELRARDDEWVLIFGAHRLEAHKLIGLSEVECKVFNVSDNDAGLIEMNENVYRVQFLPLEMSNSLARRKELYEAKYPDTKNGERGRMKIHGVPDSEDGNLTEQVGYVANAIERVGFKKSNIYRLLGLQKIIPHLHVDINSSECDLKNNVSELTALSKINVNDQHSVAHRVLSGECNTIAEASLGGERHIQVENKAQKSVLQIRSGWGRLPVERRADLLDSFAADDLPDGYKIITPSREG